MTDNALPASLARARERLERALIDADRPLDDASLLAVSKTKPASMIRQASALGQREFGENYLQEALDKQEELADLDDLVWHFIGPLQSNKTRAVAENFAWLHTIDRLKIAKRLSEQRPTHLAPLNVCLQVNISREPSKSGVMPEDVEALAKEVAALPGLKLRGLMAIPAPAESLSAQRQPLSEMRELLSALQKALPDAPLDTLSMGMSDDLEAAVLEGATLVRLGTAIFGARDTT
ncbi:MULTISPECIES: YggS family pyridoxal phosphate-dependent enzyme [Halomonadaceae]|uniref:YggS family pyridoxal phosphate-dependent enzyme n=1 Tax=Halomonadaceae TaxID=28256 RepID=UPI0018EFE48B|nr:MULTISPECIES: YggS family pyridoxal phosphate-dependent enzyme [Halomonas]MCW4151470.1 YggS family pyridoxal phosphate-dependent enzyme [Halomonas sp. 18H]MDR5887024.1 YggS family pyridoxal phosphate-dependent enzyme [Halomonas janggokensis]QPL46559.1 YggS family pyridoxal phosphate-dependent enzyme [Halomonas sp. A40-4]